jgi:ATP-binding cassette subfamily B protein
LNTTVVIVSQRASAVRDADKILVLDEGAAVGMGTHEQLMNSCEVYREIYFSQYDESKENNSAEGGAAV